MLGFSSSGSRLTLEGYTRSQLIQEAYGLKNYEVFWDAGAGSKDDVYYDIVAKADKVAELTRSEFRQMLQHLLAQRFNLKSHTESRELPVYELEVDKKGPKFSLSAPNVFESGVFGVHGRNQTINSPRESMQSLADHLQNGFLHDRPVIDRTGLKGTYDIELEATPAFRASESLQTDDLDIFSAVREQLGLRLVPAKAAVQVFVVDHIETPSAN